VNSLLPLGSGGDLAWDGSSPIQAAHRAERAARNLADLKAVHLLDADPASAANPDHVTRAQLTAGLLKQLLQTDPYAALAAFDISELDSLHHRRLIAELLRGIS
jgi:hypothetical protein